MGRILTDDPLEAAVLVLNRVYQPIRVTSARRAFGLLYRGAAQAVDELGETYDFRGWRGLSVRRDDDAVWTVSIALRVPRLVRLVRYDRVPRIVFQPSHRNIMLRDAHQCQYCGSAPSFRELNIDHVIPRSRGGTDSWENLVTACRACNHKKGGRTPDECGMRLVRKPSRPRWTKVHEILLSVHRRYKEWEPFLRVG